MAIGVDIEDIKRFKDKSDKFIKRIYTENEKAYCLSKSNPERHFAVRFCAKEAVIKALNSLGIKISEYNNIEIYHDEKKCPQVKILKKIDKNVVFQLSLSHDKSKAVAFVVAETIQNQK